MERHRSIAYRITVSSHSNRITLICIIYSLDLMQSHKVGAFFERVRNFDFQHPNEKENNSQGFVTELQNSGKATEALPKDMKEVEQWIQIKMHETYGKEWDVQIVEL